MKFYVCAALCLLALVAVEASDAGFFIPKAFYTLDSEGKPSNVHPVNPHIARSLRRLRRDSYYASSSSSSSSNGGPTYFSSQQVVQHVPDPATASINSRFGPDSASGQTSYGTNYAPVGHVVSTTGVIDQNGRVQYQTQHGKL